MPGTTWYRSNNRQGTCYLLPLSARHHLPPVGILVFTLYQLVPMSERPVSTYQVANGTQGCHPEKKVVTFMWNGIIVVVRISSYLPLYSLSLIHI